MDHPSSLVQFSEVFICAVKKDSWTLSKILFWTLMFSCGSKYDPPQRPDYIDKSSLKKKHESGLGENSIAYGIFV